MVARSECPTPIDYGLETLAFLSLTVKPCTDDLTSLCLSYLICKMGMAVPTSPGYRGTDENVAGKAPQTENT